MTLSDERDSRREANAAILQGIGEKLLKRGARLTRDERVTAGLILKGVAELIADKPADEFDLQIFWPKFDMAMDIKTNILLGTGWKNEPEEPGGAL